MSSDTIIRPASLDDLEQIVEFNRRMAAETEHKTLSLDVLGRGVRAVLTDAAVGRYFVACRDEQVIGQLLLTLEWSDWRNGQIWWIQSVYVRPEHRQSGVFRMLYTHVEELARATPGVVGLRLYVEQANLAAQQTYKKLGMRPTGYLVFETLWVD